MPYQQYTFQVSGREGLALIFSVSARSKEEALRRANRALAQPEETSSVHLRLGLYHSALYADTSLSVSQEDITEVGEIQHVPPKRVRAMLYGRGYRLELESEEEMLHTAEIAFSKEVGRRGRGGQPDLPLGQISVKPHFESYAGEIDYRIEASVLGMRWFGGRSGGGADSTFRSHLWSDELEIGRGALEERLEHYEPLFISALGRLYGETFEEIPARGERGVREATRIAELEG